MWPTHVYRTPIKPLPKWLFDVMFWLIMPAAFVGLILAVARINLRRGAEPALYTT
jgi:hypothetical protein